MYMYALQRWSILCLTVSLTGARLDVTFYNGKATPSFSGNVFIGGYSGGDDTSTVGTNFSYGRILDTGTGSELPSGYTYESFIDRARRLHLPTGAGRPGVYYCDANANTGETERLQTVLVAEEAEIKPEIQTKTVSWGDDVTLTMTTTIPELSLKWRHNGMQKSEWHGQSSIVISFAKPSDAGIYECYSNETQRSQGKHGFMRLIVRGCPNGKWGLPGCLFSCPTCYNGGMCNSDTGECVCPPGFQGTKCQTGCGKNSWGMICDRVCSSGKPDACRSTMYCLADPYGCSCTASYGGIDCATNCQSGMYGSGCTQTCHCIDGCDRATGECNSGGCEQGWSGFKCHIPDSCIDGLYGELCVYKCHCKDNAACDKTTGICSNGECAPGWINLSDDCQQDGSLQIRALYNVKVNPGEQTSIICEVSKNPPISSDDVTLVDQSGSDITQTDHHFSGMYISISNYSNAIVDDGLSYTCRVGNDSKELTTFEIYVLPEFLPSNRPEISPRATTTAVTWEKWEKGTDPGDGPVESYKVYFKKTADSDWTANRHFQVDDPDQTNYTTNITGLDWSTSYDFTVTVKRPGPRGEGSKDTYSTVNTLCDVPSEGPTITATTSSHPNALQVSWVVPDPSKIKCDDAGFIEKFHLRYRRANTQDKYIETIVNDSISREFTITELLAFTEYELMLSFNNRDEPSPWSSVHKARTAKDGPEKPMTVEVMDTKDTEIKLTWTEPFPIVGEVIQYGISYKSIDSVFKNTELQFVSFFVHGNVTIYTLEDLSPGTVYNIKVNASTQEGVGEAIALSTSTSVDISSALSMTEDIKNDIHHYGSITLVSLPIPSEDVIISKEPSLIYYVILIEYDQSSKRRRKRYTGTSGLGAYNETGPPYYITALLPLYGLPQKFIIGDGGIYSGYTNVPLTLGRQYSVYYGLKSEINGEPFYYFDEQPSIVFTAVVKGNVCHSWSTVTIIVSVIALVLILCLITVLVYTIRRQNPRKRRNEHEEVRLGKTNTKPPRKDNKEEKQDKPKEGFPDGNYQYAYENVSTQQSTDLTTTPRYQNRQNDNEERLYTGLVEELQSESEYTSLSTTARNIDTKH
ncbi:angiopoietin-1 receptor-like [Ptychodera flava]|uniref:angiopoietin-1 receptor-like n=1 Tax=Ptychodera flava TaxID=63121 RepID=UPI003969E593